LSPYAALSCPSHRMTRTTRAAGLLCAARPHRRGPGSRSGPVLDAGLRSIQTSAAMNSANITKTPRISCHDSNIEFHISASTIETMFILPAGMSFFADMEAVKIPRPIFL